MDSGLSSKVVWITGAAGGIGRELARAFAAEGARLVLSAHASFERLEALAQSEPFGADALLARADVADADALVRVAEQAVARFGRIDACIANAGAWPVEDVPLSRMDPARLRRTVEVNLIGTALTARAFLASLERSGPRADGHGAALVAIGSTAGRFGERDHADYALAKAGLRGLVATLKNEIARVDPRGRANLIEPGWTATEIVRPALQDDAVLRRVASTLPLRQLGRARDVAAAALFLASPLLAAHVSGEVLGVNGGMEGRRLWSDAEIDPAAMRARLTP
ncbi:MAG: SDR family oxidoreductase [Planctomycetota bacterium]|nr:MAG: SDR family oxidoreductase [Planctomycetota bacterium]